LAVTRPGVRAAVNPRALILGWVNHLDLTNNAVNPNPRRS